MKRKIMHSAHSPNFVSNCKRRIISFLRSINLSEFFNIFSLINRHMNGVKKKSRKKYHGRDVNEPSAMTELIYIARRIRDEITAPIHK
jgi:hypothetical protein